MQLLPAGFQFVFVFYLLAPIVTSPDANDPATAPSADGSSTPRAAHREVQDTASMMHITREQMYKEGERMCALDVFN